MYNKKICLVYNYAQHYRKEIFQLLDKEMKCDFYFGDKMDDVKKLNYDCLSNFCSELENKWFGNSFYYQKGVNRILKKKYDHYIFLGEVRCLSTWWALLYSKFTRSKVHLWTHGWYGKENRVERILKKMFFHLADNILLYGNHARELMIKEGINPLKMHVVYNSLAYDVQIKIRYSLQSNNIYQNHFGNKNHNLIFIGRLSAIKKLDMILHAVSDLRIKNERYNITFIGDGEDKELLLRLCDELKLNDVVWFYGACYNETELANMIYNADLCVSPGNVGLTAMHSMAFGTPVLTHNRYELQMPEFEAVIEGHTGSFFDYNSQESLEHEISQFFRNNFDRELLRKNCYKVIDEKYNPHTQLKTINNVLKV